MIPAVALIAIALAAAPTEPPPFEYLPPLGDIYLSFDTRAAPPVGPSGRYLDVEPMTMFSFYIMAHIDWSEPPFNDPGRNLVDGMSGWEALVLHPEGLLIVSTNISMGGSDFCDPLGNWCVAWGNSCIPGAQMPYPLVEYRCMLLQPRTDLRVSLGRGLGTSSFDPPQPGFLTCEYLAGGPYQLVPTKQRWPAHWITINCRHDCDTASSAVSWGALKAAHGDR